MKSLNLVDYLANAITNLGAVILVMCMTITGMIFFSHTLFIQVFPESMQDWEKILATWFTARGWELTVLITTCNTAHINKRIPLIMAIASGSIVLFFIRAFDSSLTGLQITQRWFVGILAATINYIYADIFYAKWMERIKEQAMPALVIDLKLKVDELQQDIIEAESQLIQAQRTIVDHQSEFKELQSELNQHQAFKKNIEQELTCPNCKEQQRAFGTLHAHKGHL